MPDTIIVEECYTSRSVILWTYGESNPDLLHAMEAFYRYTIGPSEDRKRKLAYSFSERRVYTILEYRP